MRQLRPLVALIWLTCLIAPVRADELDDFIQAQIKKRHLSGLSLAVIQDGKVVKAKGYGFIDKSGTTPVTPTTLFQAGSISKSVSAVGALYLIQAGKLALDEDVNLNLKTWKVPENEFTRDEKVTLRGLLSHSAGLTVHGFPGYEVGQPRPTVVQILDGVPPANTAPVRVEFVPGTKWRYSGGGYTVMQQLLLEVTGHSFPQFMQETVLGPMNMARSTYEQPLSADKAKATATGYYADQRPVKGRWHIYPEMAAAGLWTTPSDLARFAMGIQNAFAGKPGAVLSQAITRQLLTEQKDKDGLGVFLIGEGHTMRFEHGGRDEGFDALLMAGAETGQGVVIMINANDNSGMMNRIVDAVATHYQWAGYKAEKPVPRTAISVEATTLAAYEGRYELANNRMITFVADQGRLYTLVDGLADEEFVPETPTRFASAEHDTYLTFMPNARGTVSDLVWKQGKAERTIPRIGPLFHAPQPTQDTDPARTRRIETVLKALVQGGKAVAETSGLAPGARTAFASGVGELAGVKSILFIGAAAMSGGHIERHGGTVAHVLSYEVMVDKAAKYLLVYLTPDGLVTDYDLVIK